MNVALGGDDMLLNTKNIVSITEANQNFSRIAKIVDKEKSIIVMKNNKPKYVIIEFDAFARETNHDSEIIDTIADRILDDNIDAFMELAK